MKCIEGCHIGLITSIYFKCLGPARSYYLNLYTKHNQRSFSPLAVNARILFGIFSLDTGKETDNTY
jgi:hypothetical protein